MRSLRDTELKRFLRDFRRAHPPQRSIALLLQNVEYAVNVGSVFRVADGAAVDEVYLSGITPTPEHPAVAKTSRGKERRIAWQQVDTPDDIIAELKQDGYRICAVELVERATPYYAYDYPEKICLVAGHEEHGIPPKVLQQCQDAVFIPMLGKGQSLNVHVSLAIVCYHIRAQEMMQSAAHPEMVGEEEDEGDAELADDEA